MTSNMTAQDFAAGITTEAKHQALVMEEETRDEVERLRKETAALVERERRRAAALAKHAQEELEARAEARRERQATQDILAAKQEILDETFAAAEHALTRMPSARRRSLIRRLFERAKREIPVGGVIAAKRDAMSIRGVKVTKTEGLGGFIAISRDGKLRVDMRFESLLADIKERKTEDVAAILFREPALKKEQRRPARKAVKRSKGKGLVRRSARHARPKSARRRR